MFDGILDEKTIKMHPSDWVDLLLGLAVLLFTLLGLILPALAAIAFHRFLPSTAWFYAVRFYARAGGLVSAVLMCWVAIKGRRQSLPSDFRQDVAAVSAPFIGYFLGNNAIILGGPMLIALIAGHHVELPFTVARADGRGCALPVHVQELPFLLDEFCGVPDFIRQRLVPGTHIVVIGRGTNYGVYANSLHQVD